MKSRVPEVLGIRYPILQGGMIWVTDARLAAAVSEAGGLGAIGAGGMAPETLKEEITRAKGLTSNPFAVNIPLRRPDVRDLIEVTVKESVPVMITSAGNPTTFTGPVKEKGLKVVHVVSNVRMAAKAEEAGVDVIVAEGYEAGGHNGHDEITTMSLIPQVADAVDIPVVAAGGIADARGMVAAFALGAEGVQLGTRFIATTESPAHDNYKELVISASDTETVITGRAFGPVRVIKNALAERILKAESGGKSSDEILEMIGPGRTLKAAIEGNIDEGSFMSGQICGLIKDERTVSEIIEELMTGYETVVSSLS